MYFYIVPSENDAQHHGVLGMKWGVRRYQPYSVVPRGSGKGGEEIGEAAKYGKDDIKAAKKNVGAAFINVKKSYGTINKFEKKVKKAVDNPDENGVANVKTSVKEMNKYVDATSVFDMAVDQLIASKYVLGSDEYNRVLNKVKMQKDMKTYALFGLAGGIYSSVKNEGAIRKIEEELSRRHLEDYGYNSKKPETNKVNVSTQSSKSPFSQDEIKSKINRARNDDRWEMNFLEAIQNSEISYNNDTKAMLKEYNKYLNDPEKYWKEDRHKLKQA